MGPSRRHHQRHHQRRHHGRPRTLGTVAVGALLLVAQAANARAAPGRSQPPMVFAPVTMGRPAPPSRDLQRGLRHYHRGDYYSATISLHKVLTTRPNLPDGERAEFVLGKALYHLRFYAASLTYFERVVARGDRHKYFQATLLWLASLQRKLPPSAGILEKIGKYPRAALNAPSLATIRDELQFYLGRHHYTQGDDAGLRAAVALFRQVPTRSRWYLKAKFFEGVAQVRRGVPVAAAKAFKAILRAARPRTKATRAHREYAELARLSLARVFYQAGQLAVHQARRSAKPKQMPLYRAAHKMLALSVKYYQSLPRSSPHWLQSLFEESWALFAMDAQLRRVFKRDFAGYQRSLGNIHTLNAPYFAHRFFPETFIVRAVTYFRNCRYKKAEEAVKEFQRRFQPLFERVKRLAKLHPGDDYAFYALAQKIRLDTAALTAPLSRLARAALRDRTFRRQLAFVRELDREVAQIQRGAARDWRTTAVATHLLQDLSLRRSFAVTSAGRMARARLLRLRRELSRLLVQANNVLYEINNVRLGRLRRLGRGLRDKVRVTLQPVKVDDEHVVWPFTGAYWRDELGYYRFVIRNKCRLGSR